MKLVIALFTITSVVQCKRNLSSRSSVKIDANSAAKTDSTGASSKMILNYNKFSLDFDCSARSANRFNYSLSIDNYSAKRPRSFYMDPSLSSSCQQFTTGTYGFGYDRGHLVTSNHMDYDDFTIKQSHYMNNVVPQVSSFNQGIWQLTEAMTDCYRDIKPIYIYGGVVYTDDSNDIFLSSHGIKTPDFMWKVLVTTDEAGKDKTISWFIPNAENLGSLDQYITTIADIEKKLNDNLGPIPVKESLKKIKAPSNWVNPKNCRRS